VSRAAATGPSRSHRGKTPINWSIALVVILVFGVASIAFSRYEYAKSTAAAKPATWYAGLSFVRCGVQQAPLPASTAGNGITTPGSGVLAVSLKDKSQATLGRFVDNYPGLVLGSTTFKYPGTSELQNGDRCPAGTPDAGKVGEVRIVSWSNFSESTGRTTTNPATLALTNGQLVTAAFVPVGTSVPKPPQSTISAVLSAIGGSLPTTTTAPAKKASAQGSSDSTSSTSGDTPDQAAGGTPGTTHSSTTTKPGSTTTKPGSTTTSAGGGGSGSTVTTAGSTSNGGGSSGGTPGGTTTTAPPDTTTTAPPDTTTTAPPDTTTTAPPDTTTTTAPPDTTTTTAPPDTTTTTAGS
jgi:uncharacterized membrane protein YgcG